MPWSKRVTLWLIYLVHFGTTYISCLLLMLDNRYPKGSIYMGLVFCIDIREHSALVTVKHINLDMLKQIDIPLCGMHWHILNNGLRTVIDYSVHNFSLILRTYLPSLLRAMAKHKIVVFRYTICQCKWKYWTIYFINWSNTLQPHNIIHFNERVIS